MARKPDPVPDDPEQYRRFLETAKEVGADEAPDDDMFCKVVRRLGATPKEPRGSKKRPTKS